jgi:EAL domain-containing protein (putative c-di-GMP-specific phosphodiesterase class I)/ActR/RegA family two-component response regulator
MTLSAMVVDDDELVRGVLRRQMSTLGASPVAVARDGGEAERVLREQGPFDVILLDLMMPGVDGIEFLRSLARNKEAPDLILTSSLDPKLLRTAESLAHAHSLKVLGVLPKPIRTSAIGELLARRNPSFAHGFTVSPVTVERLTTALRAGHVMPQFQPKVCARTGVVKSVEALARWQDPQEGNISPARFIPVAERHHLIDELTMRQAEQSLRVLGRWSAEGFHPDLELNVSALSLERVEMPDQMARLALRHDVDPSRVTFEITESALIGHLSQSLDTLTRLRMKGFHLAVDDFGTGYATLSQLKMLPLSELKIDQSFVSRAVRDAETRAIVESCVALAQQFGLVSVAEGVEDADTASLLREMGATLLQGFLYSPALTESQMLQWWRGRAMH